MNVISMQQEHSIITIDSVIKRYKEVSEQEKAIVAEKDFLKKHIINTYFIDKDVLLGEYDRVIATYKSQVRTQLDITKIKTEAPDIYNKYLDIKEIRILLVK